MEFKGKRQYEIAKKVGFNRKKTRTKNSTLGYPTFIARKMMKNQQTRLGRTASCVERKPEECDTCRSRE